MLNFVNVCLSTTVIIIMNGFTAVEFVSPALMSISWSSPSPGWSQHHSQAQQLWGRLISCGAQTAGRGRWEPAWGPAEGGRCCGTQSGISEERAEGWPPGFQGDLVAVSLPDSFLGLGAPRCVQGWGGKGVCRPPSPASRGLPTAAPSAREEALEEVGTALTRGSVPGQWTLRKGCSWPGPQRPRSQGLHHASSRGRALGFGKASFCAVFVFSSDLVKLKSRNPA